MLWTAFILGLAGSLHCAGMCGPLALAVSSAGGARPTPFAGCLAYNLGRVVTYASLGLGLGLAGQSLAVFGVQRWISLGIGALILAGLFTGRRLVGVGWWVGAVETLKSPLSRALRRPTVGSLAVLGLLNGLLPCGMVYAAGGAALAAGGWREGVLYMMLFGSGTLPVMLGIAMFGQAMPFRWRLRLQGFTPVVLAITGTLLILRGLELGIPYLSPAVGDGCVHCH